VRGAELRNSSDQGRRSAGRRMTADPAAIPAVLARHTALRIRLEVLCAEHGLDAVSSEINAAGLVNDYYGIRTFL